MPKINTLGLGTSKICEVKNPHKLIREAIRSGVFIIDTAESYCNGRAEKIIGEVIREFNRERLFIISKVSPNYLSYNLLIEHAERIKERLGTYIDALLIHEPNEKVRLGESLRAMKMLKHKGVIKMFGLSNFPLRDIIYASKQGISLVEDEHNLLYRNNEILRFCLKNKIGFLAYSALAGGEIFSKEYNDILKDVGEKYSKSPSQVAIKWVLQSGAIPLISVSSLKHLEEDLDIDWNLSREDFELLSKKIRI